MSFERDGWVLFDHDAALASWIDATRPLALKCASNPQAIRDWLRSGGTWFVGVNILPNDVSGAVPGGPPLAGQAAAFCADLNGAIPMWDRAQVSVIYPGYPQLGDGESDSAFRFRRDRDAAHVDGLLPIGPDRRRKMQEPHAFVLGLQLTAVNFSAAPMVVWEGSHVIMKRAFQKVLNGVPPEQWPEQDLTEAYQAARRLCFQKCKRVAIAAQPGQAYVIHRLALHGVAPWGADAIAPPEGRVIAYFRPPFNGADWLTGP